MFLIFWKSEPQRSYKHGSYKEKSVIKPEPQKTEIWEIPVFSIGTFIGSKMMHEQAATTPKCDALKTLTPQTSTPPNFDAPKLCHPRTLPPPNFAAPELR